MKVFNQFEGDVVKINGVCYYYIGPVAKPVNAQHSDITGVFSDCYSCVIESSSSSEGTSSSSSFGYSESSSSGGYSDSSESSSSEGYSESSSSEGYSESSSSSENYSESSSSESQTILEQCGCDSVTSLNPKINVTMSWGDTDITKPFLGCNWTNGETKEVCGNWTCPDYGTTQREVWTNNYNSGNYMYLGNSVWTFADEARVKVRYNTSWFGGFYKTGPTLWNKATLNLSSYNVDYQNFTLQDTYGMIGDKQFGSITTNTNITITWSRGADGSGGGWGCN